MSQLDSGGGGEINETEEAVQVPTPGTRRGRGIVPFRGRDEGSGRWQVSAGTKELPLRYDVRADGDVGVLRCLEAPGLEVSIYRSFTFSEVEARRLGEQVILLDGAGQFPPTLDHERRLFNLDHHQGCLRAFTMATCEQALVLVLKGLELDRGDWKIYANEPDLDTVFALWVLLNHRRLQNLPREARDVLFPLLRLEGAIDANGFELAEYCGLPAAAFEQAKEQLERLHHHELELKRTGHWGTTDLASYTQRMLAEIDRLVYDEGDFSELTRIEEEFGHVEIGADRVAVVCRDGSGIYEVEKRLKSRWGNRLGVIALQTAPRTYTLRRTVSFAGIDLARAYERLNLEDPAVDGRPPEKRWGGSDEIGGSPRPGGTALEPKGIGHALWWAFRPRGFARRLRALCESAALALAPAGAALAGALLFRLVAGAPANGRQLLMRLGLAAACALVTAALLALRVSRGRLWLFGSRRPAGRDGWLLLPVAAVLCSLTTYLHGAPIERLAARALDPSGPGPPGSPGILLLGVALLLLAAGQELWLRGLVHGRLLLSFSVQRVAGPWRLTVPMLVSAVLQGGFGLAAAWAGLLQPAWQVLPGSALAWGGGGGLAAGLVLAALRERSLSLWPGFLAQLLGALAGLLGAAGVWF